MDIVVVSEFLATKFKWFDHHDLKTKYTTLQMCRKYVHEATMSLSRKNSY